MLIGRVAEATGLAACALMLAGDRRYGHTKPMPCACFGELQELREAAKVAQAEAPYRQALAIAEVLGMPPSRPAATAARSAVCHDRPAGAGPC